MKRFFTLSLALMVRTVSLAYSAGEVAIYTGQTQWIGKDVADEHADKYTKLLDDAGIKNTWFKNDGDGKQIADWMKKTTKDGGIDVVVLFEHADNRFERRGGCEVPKRESRKITCART